jgi:hypothetical protein
MRVEASGRQFVFPVQCACCGGAADGRLTASASKSTGKKVVHTTIHSWDFPYCSPCIGHVKAAESASSISILLTVVALVIAVILYVGVAGWLGVATGLGGMAGVIVLYNKMMAKAKAACGPQCACVSSAVTFLNWDGTKQAFDMASAGYATAFMMANERKLVNLSPQAQQFLEANGHGHQFGGQQAARIQRR